MNSYSVNRFIPLMALVIVLSVPTDYALAGDPRYTNRHPQPWPHPMTVNPYYPGPGIISGYSDYPGYYRRGWPQWYIRGRVNRFGDYRLDIKLRGISHYDMYRAWLLINAYRY
jgi:hypothetical protein